MNSKQYYAYAEQGFNRVPVVKEVLADLDTPLSSYLKLADGPYSFLLESVQGGEKWGRYSIIGLPCRQVLKVWGNTVRVETEGQIVEEHQEADPLAFVEQFQQRFKVPEVDGLPRFNGGLVGYFGYDIIRYVEPKLAHTCPEDPLGTPDILLMVCDQLVVFDNLSGKLILIHHEDPSVEGSYEFAQSVLGVLVHRLRNSTAKSPSAGIIPQQVSEDDFISGFAQDKFENAVRKIKDYVLAGDVMQAVLAQRMSIRYENSPLDLYRALRCLNPSPYMYYLNLDEFHVVGSSPEILARVEDGLVTVRPIAGTRKRGGSEQEDLELEEDLLADPKELAEHLMLIDLGRNDVGRVANTGSVELTDKMVIERYSHVMHIVSNVTGELKEGCTAMDVLRATFPAGTLSGAPKIRAMEIIDELEPVKRGVYGGAVGYLSWSGNMDTAIAIRTAVIQDNTLHIQAGAGVVADSVPLNEWEETLNKGRAIFRAVEMVSNGLDNRVEE